MNEHHKNNPTQNIAKLFTWLAWLCALALLAFVFQDLLDNQHNPNSAPGHGYNANGLAQVLLQQNKQGHYVTNGTINHFDVVFLLDTGATHVSIPERIARQLGLKKQNGYRVQTANGTITVYKTTIDSLTLGNITLYNVAANINPAMQSNEILLGMSALKKVEFQQTGKQLILRETP